MAKIFGIDVEDFERTMGFDVSEEYVRIPTSASTDIHDAIDKALKKLGLGKVEYIKDSHDTYRCDDRRYNSTPIPEKGIGGRWECPHGCESIHAVFPKAALPYLITSN